MSGTEQLCCGFANDNEYELVKSLLLKTKVNELVRTIKG